MLLSFSFKNFRSFRDTVFLDLRAKKITEFPTHVVTCGKDKVLKSIAIFGANGSGKSNIFKAFNFMYIYVLESFKYGGKDTEDDIDILEIEPYIFDDISRNEPSEFEVNFNILSNNTIKSYQYGFSLNQERVLSEWLRYKSKSAKEFKNIFYRNMDEVEFDSSMQKWSENINLSLEKEVLVVSLGAKLKIPKLKEIRDWFNNNRIVSFGNPIESFFRARSIPKGFADDESVRNNVIKFFNVFDPSIKGFEVEEVVNEDKNRDTKLLIDSIHLNTDTGKQYSIPLSEEPSGTLKMFSIYQELKDVMSRGTVLFVDEFNEKLHPLLVRCIIQAFLDPNININNAQLVFTSHDIWQLTAEFLRRDEIWFAEKKLNETSVIYSLADTVDDKGVKIRRDENFSKNYILGKYGGIPNYKDFSFFE